MYEFYLFDCRFYSGDSICDKDDLIHYVLFQNINEDYRRGLAVYDSFDIDMFVINLYFLFFILLDIN